ncbi:MAG TPA: HAD-IC family P-type ATPase, partial [Candidatus Lokiarchaeia archaeon]|nr:HAD-IC family P-type ATPase [Candidatus Lokiarchaeia archaeon]
MQEPVDQDSNKQISEYWNIPSDSLLQELGTSMSGLPAHIAGDFLDWYGPNVIRKKDNLPVWQSFIQQFKNPIILLLLFAAVLSAFLGDPVDAITITVIVLLSSFLDLIQEYRANAALQKLLTIIQPTATVIRDGESIEIPAKDLVPGDVVSFSVGKIIPADCVVLDAKNLFVNEMTLTGEAFPVEKKPGVSPASAGIANRINVLFMSTDVTSGTGTGLVVKTGIATEFGKISERLRLRSPETAFEKMTRNYGYFLMKITAFLVIGVFILNTLVNPGSKSIFDSFVFALALAVGMTPQLLPAIITITLANGAKTMAKKKVIVKRLNSIENFGSMNVLCSDKTGTLTEGTTKLLSAVDYQGNPSEKVMLYSYLNAFFESGFVNPIDKAILAENTLDACDFTKLDEIPYDFKRKRLSVVVSNDEANVLICKGALASILDVCSLVETSEGTRVPLEDLRDQIQAQYDNLSNEGYRVIAVGYRDDFVPGAVENGEEANLTFLGFVVFSDPLRDGITDVI